MKQVRWILFSLSSKLLHKMSQLLLRNHHLLHNIDIQCALKKVKSKSFAMQKLFTACQIKICSTNSEEKGLINVYFIFSLFFFFILETSEFTTIKPLNLTMEYRAQCLSRKYCLSYFCSANISRIAAIDSACEYVCFGWYHCSGMYMYI